MIENEGSGPRVTRLGTTMTNQEAIDICLGWLAHLDRQRVKTIKLQRLAAKARKGPDEAEEARRELRQIDRQPKVYDGARLEPAVKHLITVLTKQRDPDSHRGSDE